MGLPGAQAGTQALQGAGSARARPGDACASGRWRLPPQATPHRCALPGAACSLHKRAFSGPRHRRAPGRPALDADSSGPPTKHHTTPLAPAQPTPPDPPLPPSSPLPPPIVSFEACAPASSPLTCPTLLAHDRRRAQHSTPTRSSAPRRASRRRRRGRASGFPRSAHRASRDARDTPETHEIHTRALEMLRYTAGAAPAGLPPASGVQALPPTPPPPTDRPAD